ncbi:hypothetical protein TruAng_012197 [Truncatella angustata]|nr:hypothetical protein TruAng_012197 [Truncatella angustata]
MLDQAHDPAHDPLPTPPGDDNIYTLPEMGVHNIVVACLPAGMTGNNSAATVAKDMLRSFPIKVGLMVGTGGGVWSQKADVRLGDIVVSQPDGMHGGVVQWDFGKTEQGGVFRRTGTLNKPPRPLLGAVQEIKTKHMTDGDRLAQYLSEMAKRKPRMAQAFGYPDDEHDRLFNASYDHTGGETCESCDRAHLVVRPLRTDLESRIHYATCFPLHPDTMANIASQYGIHMSSLPTVSNLSSRVPTGESAEEAFLLSSDHESDDDDLYDDESDDSLPSIGELFRRPTKTVGLSSIAAADAGLNAIPEVATNTRGDGDKDRSEETSRPSNS